MRFGVLGLTLVLAGCSSEGSLALPECVMAESVFEKHHFIGDDLAGNADDPLWEVEATIVASSFEGPNAPVFERRSTVVRFEVTEQYLIARGDVTVSDGPVVMVVDVDNHRKGPCEGSFVHNEGGVAEEQEQSTPQGVAEESDIDFDENPWYGLPWMQLDITQQRQMMGFFDAATAAGYPGVVRVEPLVGERRVVEALDQGYLEGTFDAHVSFEAAEDGTPGCAFDVPDFAPELGCPEGAITVRYELRRLD